MAKIDIAVIGLGVMGSQHLRILRELDDFNIVGAYDPDTSVAERARRGHPGLTMASHVKELLEAGIGAAIIASPSTAHADLAASLVEQGINVLVEKPVAADVEQAMLLSTVAGTTASRILVGHIERFNPAVRGLKDFVRRGSLGQVVSISASRVGVARPAVPSTDVVLDLAIHDIDVIRFLLEQPVRVLGASGGSLPGNAQLDYSHVLLACGSATGAVEANWITPRKRRALFVTGTEGFAELDYIHQAVRTYRGKSELIGDGADLYHCMSQTSEAEVLPVARREPLRAELEHFAAYIRGEEGPVITLDEAIDALVCCVEASRLIRDSGHDR